MLEVFNWLSLKEEKEMSQPPVLGPDGKPAPGQPQGRFVPLKGNIAPRGAAQNNLVPKGKSIRVKFAIPEEKREQLGLVEEYYPITLQHTHTGVSMVKVWFHQDDKLQYRDILDICGFPFICETITTPAWFDKQVKDLAEKQKKEQAKDK